jgi:glycosyltransferase involved in cell wall biosynthesis
MNKKLKICHVITRMIVGGAQENTLLTIIGHLHKGHEVVLVTGPSPGPEGELLKKHNCPEFEIVENPHLLREINPLHDFMAYFTLKKFFASRSFDVVHTHSSKAGVIGRAAAWAAKVPFVTHTVHGQAFHQYEKAWKNFIYKSSERWAAKRCHKIYAVAQAMIDQCVEADIAPASKYKVVYSGMELEPFLESEPDEALKKELGIPDNAKVIGAIARLFPLKGYEYFIPAAKEVTQNHPEAHFLIVGDGIMTEDIKKQIKELGIDDKFSFAGLVSPNEIPRYAALMDILAHFSLREGLPRAVVQALASGKPAVAFNLDGSPEVIIDGETGYIVEPEDVKGAANALSKLLSDPELSEKLGKKGRDFVSKNWDWRLMCDVLEKEYLENT